MNTNQIINMVVRIVMRKAINKGINAGMSFAKRPAMTGRSSSDIGTPNARRQTGTSSADRDI